MNMVRLGLPHTELTVSPICLGTGDLGSKIDQATAFRMLDAFTAAGGNFLDTANVYANWLPGERSISEKTIGRWLRQRGQRAGVVIATKGAHPDLGTMHIPRLSRAEIEHDLADSLRNLQVDVIDLYWLHRDDPGRPVAEIVETLNDQVKAGKIRAFGCSNWRAPRIQAAQAYAHGQGLAGFVGDQMLWNLAVIDPAAVADKTIVIMDGELLALHRTTGLAAIPYSSQANGLFTKMAQGTADGMRPGHQAMYRAPENQERFQRAQQLAGELDVSISAVVLAYLQSQPFVTVPIVGCQNLAQLEDSLTSTRIHLTPAQVAFLADSGV